MPPRSAVLVRFGGALKSLLTELRRRNVFRVAGTYLVVAWIAMQVVEVMAPALSLPDWVDGFIAMLLVIGFPIVVFLAWVFELTPEGIVQAESSTQVETKSFGIADTVLLITLVSVLGLMSYQLLERNSSGSKTAASQGKYLDRPAVVAVLPFTNVSSDPAQNHLADGLAIDIVSRLETLRLFPIISPNSTFVYKDKAVTITQVGADLGVDYVVVGTIRRSGNSLRVTAQLADAKSGLTIWSETYDRQMAELFDLQDDIARSIAASVAPEIQKSEIGKTRSAETDDMTAYELYLKGLRLNRDGSYTEVLAARANLIAAVERDPNFAPAYVQLAWLEHDLITYHAGDTTLERSIKAREFAIEYARQAVSIDPTLAEAHLIHGHMLLHYQRTEEGIKEMELALEQNPSSAFIQATASWGQIIAGNYEAGLSALEIARSLNPHDPLVWEYVSNEAYAYWLRGDYQKARERAKESISLNGANAYMYGVLISIHQLMGEEDAARDMAITLTERFPDWTLTTLDLTSFPERAKQRFREDLMASNWRDPRDPTPDFE
jgi:TolB-like protein/Tfp pilus assembly protein PilF